MLTSTEESELELETVWTELRMDWMVEVEGWGAVTPVKMMDCCSVVVAGVAETELETLDSVLLAETEAEMELLTGAVTPVNWMESVLETVEGATTPVKMTDEDSSLDELEELAELETAELETAEVPAEISIPGAVTPVNWMESVLVMTSSVSLSSEELEELEELDELDELDELELLELEELDET
mmetsp:Transcript_132624/g.187255  ORF Transcript_132624/g.187255 Transcript_132624/m.187255 type:complete len:184 (+) Transcript_132624:217-768(+)